MNVTADGWAVDVGDTVFLVRRQYNHDPAVEAAMVVSVGGNGKVAVAWVSGGPGYKQVTQAFPVADLYAIRAGAEVEAKK